MPRKPGILTGPRGSTEGQAVSRLRLLGTKAQRGWEWVWLQQGVSTPDISYSDRVLLLHPQPADEVSLRHPMKRELFLPIHLLCPSLCLHPVPSHSTELNKQVFSPDPSPAPLRTLLLKPSRNTNPKGPLLFTACFMVGQAFLESGGQFTTSLNESRTPIHLPSLSACAFLLQRASSFRSVLEGAAPPLTIWEVLLELGTSPFKHGPPSRASASTHMH